MAMPLHCLKLLISGSEKRTWMSRTNCVVMSNTWPMNYMWPTWLYSADHKTSRDQQSPLARLCLLQDTSAALHMMASVGIVSRGILRWKMTSPTHSTHARHCGLRSRGVLQWNQSCRMPLLLSPQWWVCGGGRESWQMPPMLEKVQPANFVCLFELALVPKRLLTTGVWHLITLFPQGGYSFDRIILSCHIAQFTQPLKQSGKPSGKLSQGKERCMYVVGMGDFLTFPDEYMLTRDISQSISECHLATSQGIIFKLFDRKPIWDICASW